MLTRELAIARIEHGIVLPDRLTTTAHVAYPELARQMIACYRNGVGRARRDLHRTVADILQSDPNCPVRRIGAFCKLLDEYGAFDSTKSRRAAEFRQRVFTIAAQFHPIVGRRESLLENDVEQTYSRLEQALNIRWPELQHRLFEDLTENHLLRSFSPPEDPIALLSRYNVAQTQAALLDAVSIRVDATTDWKWILRYAKLSGLMHRIRPMARGYTIELAGPASVLRQTHRYGSAMAKFLPGLLACQDWTMVATMRVKKGWMGPPPTLELNDRSGLRSPIASPETSDSEWERIWMESWGHAPRDGWTLVREGQLLVRGQRVFIPDFVLQHRQGKRVLLELAGYWTPEYVAHRRETLQLFKDVPIVVAIPKRMAKHWQSHSWSKDHQPIFFRKALEVEDVLSALHSSLITP